MHKDDPTALTEDYSASPGKGRTLVEVMHAERKTSFTARCLESGRSIDLETLESPESVRTESAVEEVGGLGDATHASEASSSHSVHAPSSREQVLQQAEQQLSSWIEGIDQLADHAQGGRQLLDFQGVIKRYFRPLSQDPLLTNEVKMGTGLGDIFAGLHSTAEHMEETEQLANAGTVLASLAGVSLVGSTLLVLAGTEGLKQGIVDARRLHQLIKPLTAYRNVLVELQEALKKSPGETPGTAELIDMNLQGVQGRLRAAKHQLNDALVESAVSGMHATIGALGIAEGASAVAGAATAAKAVGVAYGAVVAGFGALTATRSGIHMRELDKLSAAVTRQLDEQDPLREALLDLIKHERSVRKGEVATRATMAAAGVASMGLEIAGLAGAAPTLGASLGLTAAGVAMGAATAASFNPIKSRQRAFNAVGGVERTTNLPVTFLYAKGHLNRLLEKLSDESRLVGDARRQIIQGGSGKDQTEGSNSLRYTYHAHRALAKVIPSADKRALANQIVSSPQATAEPSMKFMLQSTVIERDYLEQHKVPILQHEVQLLLAEFEAASGDDEPLRRDLVAQQLMVKAKACRNASVQMENLKDLEHRLHEFTHHLGSDFLQDEALKRSWDGLQVDFIIGHDMVAEALSSSKLKRVQKLIAAQAGGEAEADSRPDVLRDALCKNVNARFARVFAHAFPEKLDYERRGAVEVALAMFVEEAKRD